MTGLSDIFSSATPFEMARPSWAVIAPARGGDTWQAGAHDVFWTQRGDVFRCTRCRACGTVAEFESSMECGR